MTDKAKAQCLVCGSIFTLDLNGDWHCPACGAYDGNGHIEWLENSNERERFNGRAQNVYEESDRR